MNAETLAEVLAELDVCPFRENPHDASMCLCGLPALNHDQVAASVVLRDYPTIARIVQACAGEGALRERIEAVAERVAATERDYPENRTVERWSVVALLRAALDTADQT